MIDPIPPFAMTYPLAFFGFLWTTLIVGAVAASIPIIIHLLNRKRFQVVTWAAMQFLLTAQKKTTRRVQLEQFILLAIRTLVLLLTVLAMAAVVGWAEPIAKLFFPEGSPLLSRPTARVCKVIVIDNSLSMAAGAADDQSMFDKARKMARSIVDQSLPGDGFCVILLNNAGRSDPDNLKSWAVGQISPDREAVKTTINELSQTDGRADVLGTLNMVSAKLAEIDQRYQAKEVYILTDMQTATWKDKLESEGTDAIPADSQLTKMLDKLQTQAELVFVDVGEEKGHNLAITRLEVPQSLLTRGPIYFRAAVRNFGTKVARKAKLELFIKRAADRDAPFDEDAKAINLLPVAHIPVTVNPGETADVWVQHEFKEPGTYAVQLRLPGDDLEPDNLRSAVIQVKKEFKLLVVNGNEPSTTKNLVRALNPLYGKALASRLPLQPKVVPPSQSTHFSKGIPRSELAEYDCIFLCDVYSLTVQDIEQLRAHLIRGGGILISMGEKAAENIAFYNDALFRNGRGILPAKLMGVAEAPKDLHYYLYTGDKRAFEKPPLRSFAKETYKTSLSAAQFSKFMKTELPDQATVSGTAFGVRPILNFVLANKVDSDVKIPENTWTTGPAFLSWNPPLEPDPEEDNKPDNRPQVYRGNVVFYTSTWNLDWSTWADSSLTPSYIEMVHEMTMFAMSGRTRARWYSVGDVLDDYLTADGKEFEVKVFPPYATRGITDRTVGAGRMTSFYYPDTFQSGIYRMTIPKKKQEYFYAVNIPESDANDMLVESNLTRLGTKEFRDMHKGIEMQLVTSLADVQHNTVGPAGEEEEEGKSGPVAARIFMLIVLLLLFLETVLALVFGHFSSTPGTTGATANANVWWPVLSWSAFAAVFAVLGWVLIHGAMTGDFLSFLPTGIRRGIETTLGIPAAAPGEYTRWLLNWKPLSGDPSFDFVIVVVVLGLAVLTVALSYMFEGGPVGIAYRLALAGMRLFLFLLLLFVFLPQLELIFQRQSKTDVVILIDDSLSMGESDKYIDGDIRKVVEKLSKVVKLRLQDQLPGRLKAQKAELAEAEKLFREKGDDKLAQKVRELKEQVEKTKAESDSLAEDDWRPNRLQLAQTLMKQDGRDWVRFFLDKREMKVHIYHLDATGRVTKLYTDKGKPADIISGKQTQRIEESNQAILNLQAHSDSSRLGEAVSQLMENYNASSLSGIVVLTDGVTTRGRTLSKVAALARNRQVRLFFVGIGENHKIRDLELHDLDMPSSVIVGDTLVVGVKLTGKGFKKPFTVPVYLKMKEKDVETKLKKKDVVINPSDSSQEITLEYKTSKEDLGERTFIIEAVPPQSKDSKEKNLPSLRLQKTVQIQNLETIKVLYVEGSPRYEFRFLKNLLERQQSGKKKKKASFDLDVLLTDAEPNWPKEDRSAIANFPSKAELFKYHVVILGDVNPNSTKVGEKNLRNLAEFVDKNGGGLLVISGSQYTPQKYKDTLLSHVLPIEPTDSPAQNKTLKDGYRLNLYKEGKSHPIFRFTPTDVDNQKIWQDMPPMYWTSRGYRLKDNAGAVLAVHPKIVDPVRAAKGKDSQWPLVVFQFVGRGRSLFFGFDETWRWRFRENEFRYNEFWIQTMRFLARNQESRTSLTLDKQSAYRQGEKIKVTVQFPANQPPPKQVEVKVTYVPPPKDGKPGKEQFLPKLIMKKGKTFSTFEGTIKAELEGKYRFELYRPDVSSQQPDHKNPGAEANVIRPPRELERVRMDSEEMTAAANLTRGGFYTLDNAHKLPAEIPPGQRYPLGSAGPPHILWNHWLLFLLFLALLTVEWVLRKRRHLL